MLIKHYKSAIYTYMILKDSLTTLEIYFYRKYLQNFYDNWLSGARTVFNANFSKV